MSTLAATQHPSPARWRLHRAGIVNVYQYEHEVLHFGGGRLLLRGVNGSGKSTAMNMLLPFLVTARLGRIDAAGEQSGILRSWMLNGRDDPQPVGYLWIEFERAGEFLVCGCGIKANRQADSVTTWWFLTSKRPGIDIRLVEQGVPLTADSLRAVLDGGEVFGHDRRRDYRAEIERRLFGGASIDQHISLINVVRSPRVGDRIDVDLPDHLVDALPQLSDQALAEAAQPLDDLEEHRRNVGELARTADAIGGILDVYRAYCTAELRDRVTQGREHLTRLRDRKRTHAQAVLAAHDAAVLVDDKGAEIEQLAGEQRRLQAEIKALEDSDAYKSGLQLEPLRQRVAELAQQVAAAAARVVQFETREQQAADERADQQHVAGDDVHRLNEQLATAARLAETCRLTRRPPDPVQLGTDHLDAELPVLDGAPVDDALRVVEAAVLQRRNDVDDVERAGTTLDRAANALQQAEAAHRLALDAADRAAQQLRDHEAALVDAQRAWRGSAGEWATEAAPLLGSFGLELPVDPQTADDDIEHTHRQLRDLADELVTSATTALAEAQRLVAEQEQVVAAAQAVVAELAARSEPEPPRLTWQAPSDHCLADLVDFAAHLDPDGRAGLEAALEASGLLSARLADDGVAQLATGELVASVAGGVADPLSSLLVVSVPDRLVGAVDPGAVAKLLDSIATDLACDAATAVTVDGSFRVGALTGRHAKPQAELVGVTARRAALERARAHAAQQLADADTEAGIRRTHQQACNATRTDAVRLRSELPSTGAVVQAAARVTTAADHHAGALDAVDTAAAAVADADAAAVVASNALQRLATTLSLPADRAGLADVRRDLDELRAGIRVGRDALRSLARSVDTWRAAIHRWRQSTSDLADQRTTHAALIDQHEVRRAELATLEDSIGLEYREKVAAVEGCRGELDRVEARLPVARAERDDAIRDSERTRAAANAAADDETRAIGACDAARQQLTAALAVPGFFDALDTTGERRTTPVATAAGPEGLRQLLDELSPSLATAGSPERTTADGVRQSLQRRRDALGAGWDAEARQPDPSLPLTVEVNGPTGRASLAGSMRAVRQQHDQLAGLLSRKQDDALRELLQGLIAREVAEKVRGAQHLVQLMNQRLATVTTAHQVGVQLRWRRSPELAPATARMVELLATLPDLRTDEQERELRGALSARLDEARAHQPDVPYRQLIADTLDYRQWHEMAVMLRRGGAAPTRLGRNTPLSEGEKKLVTYLPLFAAVAASCDALAEQQPTRDQPGIARFVLLDDAFAKVSEDNHPGLFGLLVELDLDLIATSERLWGTHATVPELAITEVIRDASMGVILLEHYRWDGTTLQRVER